jgi:group I intron endonuclease
MNNVIYKITNAANSDLYVGSTVKGMLWRKQKHLRELRQNKHHNRHLQNAFNLYGEDKFAFVVIEELPDSKNVIEREQFWIKELGATYNVMREVKSHIGVKRSPETCKKISEALTGRKLSKQHVEDMRRSLTGRKQPPELAKKRTEHQHKPILQFTKDGIFVKEWKSATEAASACGYDRKRIYRCLWNSYGRKTYKGSVWKYKNQKSC